MTASRLAARTASMSRRAAALGLAATLALSLALTLSAQPARAATVLNVPTDFPTIQAAIVAAVDGDTVRVAPGTYVEAIDFLGKAITVESTAGRDATILDGGGAAVVVSMDAPTGSPALRGFTVRNGTDNGITTSGGFAVIEDNLVTANRLCGSGAIEAAFSAAVIRENTISNNFQSGCSGGVGGAGVTIRGAGTVQVIGNVITGNTHGSAGGGIALFAAGAPTIDRNVIRANNGGNSGGGIDIVNASNALISNNIITGNTADDGGGIAWLVPSGQRGPVVVNNTIVGNSAINGSAVHADGYDVNARLVNNLLSGGGTAAVLYCGAFNDPNLPFIRHNDVVHVNGGARYGGICPDQTGSGGNISIAPTFAAAGDFHLAPGSAGIDAGTANDLQPFDFDGDPRPADGDGDGTPMVDMGADEAPPVPLAPLAVQIDILPGTSPNVVKLTTKTIAVALLTTATFDAGRAAAPTLCFGDAEAAAQRDCTLAKPAVRKDVDADGDLDLSLVYDVRQTGIDKGDAQACLHGRTIDGRDLGGCDSIVTR